MMVAEGVPVVVEVVLVEVLLLEAVVEKLEVLLELPEELLELEPLVLLALEDEVVVIEIGPRPDETAEVVVAQV